MNFQEFFNLFNDDLLKHESEDRLKEIFDLLDQEGTGNIDVKDLKSVFMEFGESYDENNLKQMIVILDKNNNSFLDFEDFKQIVRNSKII